MDFFSSTANPNWLPGSDHHTFAFFNNNIINNNNTTTGFLDDDLSNSTNNTYNNQSGFPSGDVFTTPVYTYVWVTLTNLLVLVTGVAGNTLVIVVVVSVKDMWSPTNICLMHLSLADLLVLLICQPSAMLEFYALEKWMLGAFMCKLTVFLENMVCLASILIILCISFDRYFAVCSPFKKHPIESKATALRLMLAMWVIAAVVTSPMFAIAQTSTVLHYVEMENVTVCMSFVTAGWPLFYVHAQFIVVFVVPLCLLVFAYTQIFFKATKETVKKGALTDNELAKREKTKQQLMAMLMAIVALFFICLLPFRIAALCWIYGSCSMELEARLNLLHLFRLLVYVNSAGNPIIYSLMSTKFREAFSKVLLRMGCRCRFLTADKKNGSSQKNTDIQYTSVRSDNDVEQKETAS